MKPHPAPSHESAERLTERVRQALEGLVPPDAQVPERVILDTAESLFYSIVARAADYFAYCPDDFGIQSINAGVIVFGGTNRLLWSVTGGFNPDPSYCTKKFLEQFEGEVWESLGQLECKTNQAIRVVGDDYLKSVLVKIDPRFNSITIAGRRSRKGDGKLAEVKFNTGVEA